uniref:heme attachment to plastid cytochrome c n=1 Tax=Thalassionema bacillare TaxID=426664 RepID=UPI001EE0EA43|nr:heme attachment to plastid cytochrome c [Thalassionema bacillare]UHY40475.1 heme attachment to plastid cytochrome c [Thalassionema bacillare]UHY40862.1 heme attachment to plastid cytochrome c [Thalassionema bacillare]UHY41120.1 heme attachment to plastid cytochrome c [Thalassionema bacillare]
MNWDIIQNLASQVVFVMLLFGVICYWINLYLFSFNLKTKFQLRTENLLFNLGKLCVLIGNCLLIFILFSRWIIAGYFPLSNLYESLLFLTWVLSTVYLYVESKTKSKLIGATLIPVALLINGFSNLTLTPEMQKASPLVPALQSNWLMLHVSMMLLSYGTLIMGSLLCILFLTISFYKKVDFNQIDFEKSLKSSNFLSETVDLYIQSSYFKTFFTNNTINDETSRSPFELPEFTSEEMDNEIAIIHSKYEKRSLELAELNKLTLLENLDNWSYRILGLGFPFLTIGIISGGVWANEAWGSYWSWDPKETWALITWIIFATYLHARITKGWKGRKTAILGGLGFFVIWICYLGVNFLGKGLHSYGWFS